MTSPNSPGEDPPSASPAGASKENDESAKAEGVAKPAQPSAPSGLADVLAAVEQVFGSVSPSAFGMSSDAPPDTGSEGAEASGTTGADAADDAPMGEATVTTAESIEVEQFTVADYLQDEGDPFDLSQQLTEEALLNDAQPPEQPPVTSAEGEAGGTSESGDGEAASGAEIGPEDDMDEPLAPSQSQAPQLEVEVEMLVDETIEITQEAVIEEPESPPAEANSSAPATASMPIDGDEPIAAREGNQAPTAAASGTGETPSAVPQTPTEPFDQASPALQVIEVETISEHIEVMVEAVIETPAVSPPHANGQAVEPEADENAVFDLSYILVEEELAVEVEEVAETCSPQRKGARASESPSGVENGAATPTRSQSPNVARSQASTSPKSVINLASAKSHGHVLKKDLEGDIIMESNDSDGGEEAKAGPSGSGLQLGDDVEMGVGEIVPESSPSVLDYESEEGERGMSDASEEADPAPKPQPPAKALLYAKRANPAHVGSTLHVYARMREGRLGVTDARHGPTLPAYIRMRAAIMVGPTLPDYIELKAAQQVKRQRVEVGISSPWKAARRKIDRAMVVIPISRKRRAVLIERGFYGKFALLWQLTSDPARDDADEAAAPRPRQIKPYQHPSLGSQQLQFRGGSRGAGTGTVRLARPEAIPNRFIQRSGPALFEPWASVLTPESLRNRLGEYDCEWDECDAVLASETKLIKHVAVRKHAQEGRFACGPRGELEAFRCHWYGCERPCFETEEELVQHMTARHLARVLHCPYGHCDLQSPTLSHLQRHVTRHHEATETPRPLVDRPLRPALKPLPTLPHTARVDELTTQRVRKASYKQQFRQDMARQRVLKNSWAPPEPETHVVHPPHMLQPLEGHATGQATQTNGSRESSAAPPVRGQTARRGKKRKFMNWVRPKSHGKTLTTGLRTSSADTADAEDVEATVGAIVIDSDDDDVVEPEVVLDEVIVIDDESEPISTPVSRKRCRISSPEAEGPRTRRGLGSTPSASPSPALTTRPQRKLQNSASPAASTRGKRQFGTVFNPSPLAPLRKRQRQESEGAKEPTKASPAPASTIQARLVAAGGNHAMRGGRARGRGRGRGRGVERAVSGRAEKVDLPSDESKEKGKRGGTVVVVEIPPYAHKDQHVFMPVRDPFPSGRARRGKGRGGAGRGREGGKSRSG